MAEEKEDGLAAVQQRFRAYYEANLRGDYNGLEPVRQKYLRQFRRRLAICVAVAGAYVAFCTVRQLNPETVFSENALWIYFAFLSVAGTWVTRPSSHYKKDSKKLVMNKILAFWGNMRYLEKGSDITWDSLVQSCLFGSFDGRDVDDDLTGTYNGTDIKISEQHLTRLVRTRRGSRRQTVAAAPGARAATNAAKPHSDWHCALPHHAGDAPHLAQYLRPRSSAVRKRSDYPDRCVKHRRDATQTLYAGADRQKSDGANHDHRRREGQCRRPGSLYRGARLCVERAENNTLAEKAPF